MIEGRHLAAIMFVDMVGYAARMQESEPRTIAAVRSLWDRVRPILAGHGGREVDLAGDGMLMEFPGALAAVRCALQIHTSLHEANRALPAAERIRVRAGVHLGDIEHRDGRIYGDGVNIAARILPLSPPGGIAMTPHVSDQLFNVLDSPPQRLGSKTLKHIKRPIEIWCIPGPDCSAADLAAAREAAQDESAGRRWSFGNIAFDERTLELSVAGTAVELEKKALDVLTVLLHRAGEVVTKDELIEAAWPGRVISDSALTSSMAKLRSALADDEQQIIRTMHGFGYRLAVPVKVETTALPALPRFDFKPGDHPPLRPLWALVRSLGQGGHGEVWLARHEKTREERVYKFATDPAHLASLKREITLSRILNDTHGPRHFVRVLDWNLEQLPYFIECEYSPRGSLVDWAESQGGLDKVPLETRLDLAAQIAEALAAAHSLGVLHKDLKPDNVLVSQEAGQPPTVKLADFGSGGVLDPQRLESLGITRMGFTRTQLDIDSTDATPLYMAPEVLAGQPWTSKADIYALGLILFQLVTGDLRRPLAPGWEKDVADELLRRDILLAASGNPDHRLGDAALLAQSLRTLGARREQLGNEARAREKMLAQQKLIERYRYRRWWTASVTFLLTLVSFYGVFMETDYGRALFFTYDKVWEAAEKHESSGNLREAEALIRHIVATEEDRATLKFGLFVLFAGPDYLVQAKLKLAQLHWRQGRLADADADYRDALTTITTMYGPTGWRSAAGQFEYAEFLAETGRSQEARDHLALAEDVIKAIIQEGGGPGLEPGFNWNEGEAGRGPIVRELVKKIAALRHKHGLAARP